MYPDGLKTARIVPVYKSGDKDQIENYRPISVLSVINTIFEKLIHKQLSSFLENVMYLVNRSMASAGACQLRLLSLLLRTR